MAIFKELNFEPIFKNEDVLHPEYMPATFMHREQEMRTIAACMQPAIHKRRPINVFIYGNTGLGKTGVIKHILKEIGEFETTLPIYINCWEYMSRHAVLTQILINLGFPAPRSGTAFDVLYSQFKHRLSQTHKIPLITLDEVDKLLYKSGPEIFYDLLRAGSNLGLIGISNDPHILRRLDARIKSSLFAQEVYFNEYNQDQVLDILKSRANLAFRPGMVEKEAIECCAQKIASQGGDIRKGLEILWKAGRQAEAEGTKLKIDHILQEFKKISIYKQDRSKDLGEKKLKILEIIKKHGPLTTGEIYKKLSKTMQIPPRTFRLYLTSLDQMGFIKREPSGKGQVGNTRIISLK
jgi:cell division control protein 6